MKLSNIWSWGMIILLSLQISLAQDLINYNSRANLNLEQEKYLRIIKEDATTSEVTTASIDVNQLEASLVNMSMPNGQTYLVQKTEDQNLDIKRSLFVGKTLSEERDVIIVKNGSMITAHIETKDKIYSIRPIGEGQHAIITLKPNGFDTCGTNSRLKKEGDDEADKAAIKRMIPRKYQEEGVVNENSRNANGDAKTRVLVAYTEAVGDELEDPLSTIHLAISLANTAYRNSGINQELELARAIQVKTEGASLGSFRNNGDGIMDEIHTERTRWKADMCHLLTNEGGAVAYITKSFGYVFAKTNYKWIDYKSFTHETGHNHQCNHDPSDYRGSSTYRGYGHPDGYFRTIMAYPAACGTGDCPRVNEFSGPDNTYYHAETTTYYTTGSETQNNVAGHNQAVSTNANHYSDYETANFEGITVPDDEAVHAVARLSLQNNPNSDEDFIYESGAEGSFKASNQVTLKPGFWAKRGSEFEGKIEEYGPALSAPASDEVIADAVSGEDNVGDEIQPIIRGNEFSMKAYPNPFREQMTIDYQLDKNSSIRLYVRNALGQVVKVLHQGQKAAGQHRTQLQAGNLASGVYYLVLETPQERKVEKIVIAGY